MSRTICVMSFVSFLFVSLCFADDVPKPVAEGYPNCVLASVRIGANGGCSGTIFLRFTKLAYGLSAAHCYSGDGVEFTFGNADGTGGQARWLVHDPNTDLSLFVCWSEDTIGVAGVPRELPSNLDENGIIAVGYPGGEGPKWKRFEYVKTDVIHSSTFDVDIERHLMKTVKGQFGSGDSGGGVFLNGDLCFVMTHTGPHVAEHKQVLAFLEANRDAIVEDFDAHETKGNRCYRGSCPKHDKYWSPSPEVPKDSIPHETPYDLDSDKERALELVKLRKWRVTIEDRLAGIDKKIATLEAKVGRQFDTPPPPVEQGPPGPKGDAGPQGPPGPPGKDGQDVDVTVIKGILSRLKELESQQRKVVLMKNGRVVDQESYSSDEPIVLDVKSLTRKK